jgi:beta-lactam-binding protein with PASTA domain
VSVKLVLGVCAAAAVAACGAQPSAPPGAGGGTATIVVPRVVGMDVADAVAVLDYVQMIPALIDRRHRPLFAAAGDDAGCRVIRQRPRARTEVVVGEFSELTVTVTITVRC